MNKVLTEIWNFIKLNFKFLLVAAVLLIFYFQGCFDRFGNTPPPTRDTVVTQIPQPIVIMPPYTPQQSGNTVFPINIPSNYNPSQDIVRLTEQYNELVKQFLAVKTYKDSIQLKDTAGNRVGVVDLTQIVSENELKSTQPTYQLSFPHTTITIREPYVPRNQVFIGGGVGASLNKPSLNQAELGLLLKNKRDNVFGLSGTYDIPNKSPGLKVSYYKKLSFRLNLFGGGN
jgi:hypothetical protein